MEGWILPKEEDGVVKKLRQKELVIPYDQY